MHEVQRQSRRIIPYKGLIFACLQFLALCVATKVSSLSLDGRALLELKKSITRDPLGVASDWNESDADPCSWTGVTCGSNGLNRVVALNISGRLDCPTGGFSSSVLGAGDRYNSSLSPCSRFLRIAASGTQFSDSCSTGGIFPESISASAASSDLNICLENGSVLNSSIGYQGGDQVACKLAGKLSPFIGNLTELRVLFLPYNAFYGDIPREISKLRVLEVLELQGNSLTGQVPSELSKLSSLRVLNLGYNSLAGRIPIQLGRCLKLQTLNLAGNMLNGTIPPVLGDLPQLKLLSLSFNQLSGPIPVELVSSCQSLEYFHLSSNLLTGEIPPQLGNCSRLRSVSLFSNILEGSIPTELGRLSMLETLDVSRNCLSRGIPKELANCHQLSVLVLTNLLDYAPGGNYTEVDPSSGFSNSDKGEYNYFEGGIPASLVTLPQLQILWAPRATLNGPLPEDWGDCSCLQILNLGQNLFTGQIPAGLEKCKNLFFLDLSSNRLKGDIPELPVSCMLFYNISGNSLSGNISTSMKFDCPKQSLFPTNGLLDFSQAQADPAFLYSSLFYCGTWASTPLTSIVSEGLMVFHDLSANNFTGPLPPLLIGDSLMREHPSYGFLLNNNQLTGNISSSLFASCPRIRNLALNVSGNHISGDISAQMLGDCKSLKRLEASFNQITGSVPSAFGNLVSLEYLDLSVNGLQGSVPPQLGQLKKLQYLLLAENNITGAIPEEIGELTSLIVLDLSSNALTGKIPEDLTKLRSLKDLFLEKNRLSGQIPNGFAKLPALMINVSYNNLSGQIPQMGKSVTCDSFKGNQFLEHCHSALSPSQQQEPIRGPFPYASPPVEIIVHKHDRFNSIQVAALTSASAIVFVLAVLVVLFQYTRRCIPNPPGYRSRRKEVVTFTNIGVQLSYENVVRATGNFSVGNLIGNGGFGATYKAELTPGFLVAVKRLSIGKFQGIQQFDTEIRTLGRIRHPNLVTLIGYHASKSEMFLIYNYLPGGNLESFIHETSTRNVDWCILHKIALDIAEALAYLHDECVPRVLHRDIKPSNILLDNNLNAYLSDFGLARLLGASETHATTDVAGTFGYLAPEYAMTCRVSDKADVYSYGVVLLELLSGKKALDPSFSSYGNGFNIVAWACMLLREGRARELYTTGLWDVGPHDDLVEALHLAVMCTVDSLSIRPLMRQVVERLKQIQPPPLN
eukprot:Gb_23729 [translate_table: standard]